MSLIEKLTPEQEALIPVYREKWRAIALSTERIDREKAAESVKVVYAAFGVEVPEIVFCDSPYAAFSEIFLDKFDQLIQKLEFPIISRLNKSSVSRIRKQEKVFQPLPELLGKQIDFFHEVMNSPIFQTIDTKILYNCLYLELDSNGWDYGHGLFYTHLQPELITKIYEKLHQPGTKLHNRIGKRLWFFLRKSLGSHIGNVYWKSWQPDKNATVASVYDFYFKVLNFDYDVKKFQHFQSLIIECGWIFGFEKVAIICDRPLHLRFDNQNRLHAEGEPAIEFTDGYSLYSSHGVTLPEKYGKIHPQQWQSQWLLTEENAELRRVLIQGIGYARICQELQAIELDNWQEYTLLKIDNNVDIEPIYLLKMTCPSTSFIHALRVPPSMNSAREAIRWVNWGVDSEEFGVQT
ncbi:hypothetical protein NLP_4346 [Nostoc sp. 'Lobaria pulmonaria (5183) cyanobiont']|nr:hypothetical protein [Nostoc sp. 'Lobaria pulmonaria (5183) cyanobiont']AVH72778.1 hypothetical protein NLP_4346 [Nostoc sp. 'Lobaria pulmonaria (5183) cyanobiont']